MRDRRSSGPRDDKTGRVIATLGRRVLVRDDDGERVCFLSGQRAVVGDVVTWVPAPGEGGKLTGVLPRSGVLERRDFKGRDQVVAAHLGGLVIVASAANPAYRPGLIDRYLVATSHAGLGAVLVVTKTDLGLDDAVQADIAWRRAQGLTVLPCCPHSGDGLDDVVAWLTAHAHDGPWALVGHSGVGKTSLLAALLPGVDVGPIGEVSEYWDQGRHTTTSSRIHALPGGAELADSPGIRTFLPSGLQPTTVRDHFWGLGPLPCRYRDCLHRPEEDGCVAEAQVDAAILERYRRLLDEVCQVQARRQP